MARSLLSVLLLCLALLSLTQAVTIQVRTGLDTAPAERELSNGERMVRGLGPNKPRKLYEPTAVRRKSIFSALRGHCLCLRLGMLVS